jgi:erythritol transport system ATP-binding protein
MIHPIGMTVQGGTKVYPGTRALKSVDSDLRMGAVNVLVGENGAGKSTLTKVIAGVEPLTEGRIELAGKPVQFRSNADAVAAGMGIVFQDLNLFLNRTVAENISIGRAPTCLGINIDARQQYAAAAPFIATLGTLYVARGAALLASGGHTFPNLGGNPEYGSQSFAWIGSGTVLGIPFLR